ncbi:hypothetical protein PRIPAC_79058 [Pristionchus pacificus]|uniref:G protein-coupled receptor n=1 Tax=Pristionchus pacificus TaxID=54126 RepID=A0A2A6CQN3_PRIPA|nr:hypothetical protein PRIPAC_79058 [Pristionchus pacificus]|eukprot:PDM80430.1 G protein-coupled receptor [Pristionchus pacificus]
MAYADPVLNDILQICQIVISVLAYIFNFALIAIVHRHARKEIGKYRILITFFALSDIYYNTVHFLVYPVPENYGNAFFMRGHGLFPDFLGVGLYMGAYGHEFPILIFHFVYRLYAVKNPENLRFFPIFIVVLVLATAASNALWFSIFHWFFHPDEESLRLLSSVFNGSIALPMLHASETASMHSQALYWVWQLAVRSHFEGNIKTGATFEGPRWRNLFGTVLMFASMIFTYVIIVYCCIRINNFLKERVVSEKSVRLHKQLFRSLIYQVFPVGTSGNSNGKRNWTRVISGITSFIPLFTAYYPAGSALLLPIFGKSLFEFETASCGVGVPFIPIAYAVPPACASHPLFNPMLLMFTISDYRRVIPTGENWTMTKGASHPLFGFWSISWGMLCELLYIPCIYALHNEIGLSCYRIMLWLAIVDVIAILCNSICFGFFLIEGTVFCSRPWSVWIVGCVGLGTEPQTM